MRLRFVYTFLLLTQTSIVDAQQAPTVTCLNYPPGSSTCIAAATVYNDIMANAVATTAIAEMVTTVQNTTPQEDLLQQTALQYLAPSSSFMNLINNCNANRNYVQNCDMLILYSQKLQSGVAQLNTDRSANSNNLKALANTIVNLAKSQKPMFNALAKDAGTLALATLVGDLNNLGYVMSAINHFLPPPSSSSKRSGALGKRR